MRHFEYIVRETSMQYDDPMALFLSIVHKHTPDDAFIGLSTLKDRRMETAFYRRKYAQKLLEAALAVGVSADVYLRTTAIAKPPQHGRGTERASIGASCLYCDYDAYVSQVDALTRLRSLSKPPTLIVDSGYGLHAYWLLDKLYTDLDAIKARNKQLVVDLNSDGSDIADSCYDLARVLRVPGTYNRKRNPAVLCTIIEYNPQCVYQLEDFAPAELEETTITHWEASDLDTTFLDTLYEQDKILAKRIESLQLCQRAKLKDLPEKRDGSFDRSRNDAWIATKLLSLGYEPSVILAVLSNPEWLSGEKYASTGRWDYVVTTVNNATRHYNNTPDRYFVQKKLATPKLADELANATPFVYVADKLWRYDAGVFKPDAKMLVEKALVTKLGGKWHTNYVKETLAWLTAQYAQPLTACNQHDGLVNVANGMLDLDSGKLLPHSSEYASLAQIPALYDPNVDTTQVDQFVASILPADAINTFWEFVGSCLDTSKYQPKAFLMLTGKKDSGKSKLLAFIMQFLGGDTNVSSVSLQSLADNRFASSLLAGKLANIFSDLSNAEVTDAAIIKRLTGDDTQLAEEKYKAGFSFHNTARLIFSANETPPVRGSDDAYFDRAVLMHCPYRFVVGTGTLKQNERRADTEIVAKLATPTNFSATLLRCYQGLQRLKANNWQVGITETMQQALLQYRIVSDTVKAFLSICPVDDAAVVEKRKFFLAYRQWTKESGHMPVSDQSFYRRMANEIADSKIQEEYRYVQALGMQVHFYVGRRLPDQFNDGFDFTR
jgi:P4 family phage/plasmid primase-like protien